MSHEPLKILKDQILIDFIVEHRIDVVDEIIDITFTPWKLYVDGLSCKEGQGIGLLVISMNVAIFETSCHLEYFWTDNQPKYEALLSGLDILQSMGVKCVGVFGGSLIVVHQVSGAFQCL